MKFKVGDIVETCFALAPNIKEIAKILSFNSYPNYGRTAQVRIYLPGSNELREDVHERNISTFTELSELEKACYAPKFPSKG